MRATGVRSRICLRETIPTSNCTMRGQNIWGNWGSPGVMKLSAAWEVLRWLVEYRGLIRGGFHPKWVTPPFHGFLNANTKESPQSGSIIIGSKPLLTWGRHRRKRKAIRSIIIIVPVEYVSTKYLYKKSYFRVKYRARKNNRQNLGDVKSH